MCPSLWNTVLYFISVVAMAKRTHKCISWGEIWPQIVFKGVLFFHFLISVHPLIETLFHKVILNFSFVISLKNLMNSACNLVVTPKNNVTKLGSVQGSSTSIKQ